MNQKQYQFLTTLCLALALSVSLNLRAAVTVEPPGATVAGKTIAEWSTNWWRWGLSFGPTSSPFYDSYGWYANLNQSGPVFFLAGSPGGSNSRYFEVPPDKYVLIPLLVGELSQLEVGFNQSAAEVRQAAKLQADLIDSLHATLDGVPIPQGTLFAHREASPDFGFVASAGNAFGVPTGSSGIAVADGYFLMLDPLPTGVHVLTYGGGLSLYGISISETDTITVGAPKITVQPTNQTVVTGDLVTLAVGVSGSSPLSYQWYYNEVFLPTNGLPIGRPLNNETSAALTFKATLSSAGVYFATASNAAGLVASQVAFLTVQPVLLFSTRIGNEFVLSWTTNASAFKLQSATNLTPPVIWIDSTNVPTVVNGDFTVTNPTSRSAKYYRLKH